MRNKLREAVNGPAEEMEQRVREIIPPVLCAIFPDEARKLLNDCIVVDPMAKKKLQGPLEARLREIETAREILFQSMRAATAPRQ